MYYSKRDLRFQLFELLDAESLLKYPYFQDHNRDSFDMVLEAADSIAEKMLFPLLTEMDRNEPQLVDGKIRVHEGMKAIVKKFGEDGWISAPFKYEYGGQQMPATVLNAATFILQAANFSALWTFSRILQRGMISRCTNSNCIHAHPHSGFIHHLKHIIQAFMGFTN